MNTEAEYITLEFRDGDLFVERPSAKDCGLPPEPVDLTETPDYEFDAVMTYPLPDIYSGSGWLYSPRGITPDGVYEYDDIPDGSIIHFYCNEKASPTSTNGVFMVPDKPGGTDRYDAVEIRDATRQNHPILYSDPRFPSENGPFVIRVVKVPPNGSTKIFAFTNDAHLDFDTEAPASGKVPAFDTANSDDTYGALEDHFSVKDYFVTNVGTGREVSLAPPSGDGRAGIVADENARVKSGKVYWRAELRSPSSTGGTSHTGIVNLDKVNINDPEFDHTSSEHVYYMTYRNNQVYRNGVAMANPVAATSDFNKWWWWRLDLDNGRFYWGDGLITDQLEPGVWVPFTNLYRDTIRGISGTAVFNWENPPGSLDVAEYKTFMEANPTKQAELDVYAERLAEFNQCLAEGGAVSGSEETSGASGLSLLTNAQGVGNRALTSLLIRKGSCIYDLDAGFPWDRILGFNNPVLLETLLRNHLRELPFVASIDYINIEYEQTSRQLTGRFTFTSTAGDSVPIVFNTINEVTG